MSGWNHRVLAHRYGDQVEFQIHEVYYDDNDLRSSYTAEGVSVSADEPEGLIWVLDKMRECLDKPILDAKDWPNEYISNEH